MTLLKEIKERVNNRLELSDEDVEWLIGEAETLSKIRMEAEEMYNEETSLMDFGERVDNLL